MSQSELPRQRVSEEVLSGSVIAWMGHYGWIKPEVPIAHDAAKMRDGRVYVNKRDVGEGTLAQGAKVTFKLFEDPSGIGAEEVSVVAS